MRKKIFITFGDEKFKKARKYCALSARIFGGFDKVITFTPDDIENDFLIKFDNIFKIKRGYGLWLWKPYIIYKTLKDIANEGDMLFYCDAGAIMFRNINYIEDVMGKDDIWVSFIPLIEWQFTKKDAFSILNCDKVEYKNSPQIQGGFIYLRKSKKSMELVKEWLNNCCNINLLHPNNILTGYPNPKGFVEHREDQSILSLLCKKHGIQAHLDPTQFSLFPERYYLFIRALPCLMKNSRREYPVCIILHRSPFCSLYILFKEILFLFIPQIWGRKFIFWKAKRRNR